MGLHTPRLYLFSRKDRSSPWQEVEHHAKTAKERGMDVRCELFEESEHTAYIRVEPERYWSSVQDVWVVAVSKEKDEKGILQTPPALQGSVKNYPVNDEFFDTLNKYRSF
ncbi:hypothetical protein BDR04DRAFT_1165280 [Suillus decipiens]|nr:hypothetical protein BDR04DRAFT_1165280 [Suillus decipiens]